MLNIELEFFRNINYNDIKEQKNFLENYLKKNNYFFHFIIDNNLLFGKVKKIMIDENQEKKEYILKILFEKWEMLSNSLIDRHNECFSKEVLESMEKSFNEKLLPMYVEHNYSNPPIGIWVGAKLIEFNKEYYLFGKYHLFNDKLDEDTIQYIKNKKIVLDINQENQNIVIFDRNFEIDEEISNEIKKFGLDNKSNIKVKKAIKKSFEFIPEVIISGVVIFVGKKFFENLIDDFYKQIKEILFKLLKNKKIKEGHLIFSRGIKLENGKIVLVKVIIVYSEGEDININLDKLEEFIQMKLKKIIDENLPIANVVCKVEKDKDIQISYCMTENGFIEKNI